MEAYIINQLKEIAGEAHVYPDEPMKKHVTFRTGGNADCFVVANGTDCIRKLVTFLKEKQIAYYVIGNGSNLLFSDEGYRGVVIKIGKIAEDIQVDGNRIQAGAGLLLSQIAKYAYEAGLTGMEFAAGIPGSLGGAAVMNAGAYGGELKDILESVEVLTEDGEVKQIAAEDLELSYRHSIIPERNYIVLSAVIKLQQGNKEDIKAQMDELAKKRREKQPLEYPSGGSTFKRPEGYFAAKLIEDAGLKGFTVGGAQVSEKHSGFVINIGDATTTDILTLTEEVKKQVYEKFQVTLEMEVKVVR